MEWCGVQIYDVNSQSILRVEKIGSLGMMRNNGWDASSATSWHAQSVNDRLIEGKDAEGRKIAHNSSSSVEQMCENVQSAE